MKPLRLQLDWLPNAQFAGILYAYEKGWYQKAGIELDIIPWTPYLNQVDVLKQYPNTVVSTEDNLLIKGVLQGEPVVAIATMMQYSGLGWMVLNESNIQTLRDLQGKKIGIHTDGRTGIEVALNHVGLSRDDVEIEDVDFDYERLLCNKEVAAMQCLSLVEPLELKDNGVDISVFLAKDHGYLVYSQVFATTRQLLEKEPDMLAAFTKISFDGWRAAFADKNAAAELVVQKYHKESTVALQEAMLSAMEPLFPYKNDINKMGMMEKNRWETSIQMLKYEGYDVSALRAEDVMSEEINRLMFS